MVSDPHEWVRVQLSAYIDGEVAPGERQSLEQHLAECAACAREERTLRATVAALRALPRAAPRRTFELSPEMAAKAERRRSWFWPLQPSLGSALALALFVVVAADLGRQALTPRAAGLPSAPIAARSEPPLSGPPTSASGRAGTLAAASDRAAAPSLASPAAAPAPADLGAGRGAGQQSAAPAAAAKSDATESVAEIRTSVGTPAPEQKQTSAAAREERAREAAAMKGRVSMELGLLALFGLLAAGGLIWRRRARR